MTVLCLSVPVYIQFKVLILVPMSQFGLVPKYLCDLILRPSPLCQLASSSSILYFFIPRHITHVAQPISSPSPWHRLPIQSVPLSYLVATCIFLHLFLTSNHVLFLGVACTCRSTVLGLLLKGSCKRSA